MRIPSGASDRYLYFVAVDATDLKTRETGLSGFTVVRSRNGAADVTYTTPTVAEIDSATMPGLYALLVDEDTTIAAAHDTEEYAVHITHASMAPVSRVVELYRPKTTEGTTLSVESDGMGHADLKEWLAVAPLALSSQRVQALIGAIAAGAIDAAAIGTGAIDADAIAAGAITSSEAPALANLDAAVSTRLATAGYTAPDNAGISSINGRLPSDPADASDIAAAFAAVPAAVWAAGTRTLTSFGTLVSDVATAVWAAGARTLTSFGTLVSDVWSNATRTLTASLDPTAVDIRTEMDTNSTMLAGIKAQTDNLPSGIARNTALPAFTFLMVDSADHVTPKTGLAGITAQRSLDAAAFAACANSPTEVGYGIYAIDLAAADLNGHVVTLRFAVAGADVRLLTIVTDEEPGT